MLGGDRRSDGGAPGRGDVGRRPQPPVARPRRPGHRRGPPRRHVRGRGLAHGDGQVRPAAGAAPRPARPYRRDAQRGVPAAAALRRARPPAPPRGAHGRPGRRGPARHLPRSRRPRPGRPDRRLPPGRRGQGPPVRRVRLHDQGLVAAHRGSPGQPLGAAQPRAVPRARGQARGGRGRAVPAARRRRRRAVPHGRRTAPARADAGGARTRRCRPTSAASTPARPARSRRSGGSSST